MTLLLAQVIFWTSVAAILYVYVGYPLLAYLFSRVHPKPVRRGEIEPTVSIIITAYNEEADIRAKLENTLALDYPEEKLEIIVASDCSTDGTDRIAGEFAGRGVKLLRQPVRNGKTSAQNSAVEIATGDIVLFSDATTMYRPDVLRSIVPNFADETVGCVAGKLLYVDESGSGVGEGAKGYWSYETFLKEAESRGCSLIGASGCLYAVRRKAYVPMYPEACSDFLIATLLYRQGLRTIYEPAAVCSEETNRRSRAEMRMRVRVISQTFTDLWRNRDMMNPFKSGMYGIELISHKLLRYFAPLFFLLMLASSAVLAPYSLPFALLLGLQLAFCGLAVLAWIFEERLSKIGVLAIPFYFLLTNLSSVLGFYKFLRGERYAHWEPIRGSGEN